MNNYNKIFNESYFSGVETNDETEMESEEIRVLPDEGDFNYEIRVNYYTGILFGSYPSPEALLTLPEQFRALDNYIVSLMPSMRFIDSISQFVVEAGDVKDEVYPFDNLSKAKFSHYGSNKMFIRFRLKGHFDIVRQLYQFMYILLFPPMRHQKNSICGYLFNIKVINSPKYADFTSTIILEKCIRKRKWLYQDDVMKDISLEALDQFMFLSSTIFSRTKSVYKQTMNICGLKNYEMASITTFQKKEYPNKDSQLMRVSANLQRCMADGFDYDGLEWYMNNRERVFVAKSFYFNPSENDMFYWYGALENRKNDEVRDQIIQQKPKVISTMARKSRYIWTFIYHMEGIMLDNQYCALFIVFNDYHDDPDTLWEFFDKVYPGKITDKDKQVLLNQIKK